MRRGSQRVFVSQKHHVYFTKQTYILIPGVHCLDQFDIHNSLFMSTLTIKILLSSSPLL